MRKIEICCGSVDDVIAARFGGAIRVELCAATDLGGVTPSAGLIVGALREKGEMQVHVLVRPRPGDFVYDRAEVSTMEADIAAAREAGADGVVIGALTPAGELDMPVMQRLLKAAEGMNVTFHRAFDETAHPEKVLEQLIELGISRVLTSGGKPGAFQGLPLLRRLVHKGGDRIIVMPGAGINPVNIKEIEAITGAREFHSTATDKGEVRAVSPLFGQRPLSTRCELVRALVGE